MSRKKTQSIPESSPSQSRQTQPSIINLKGTDAEREWLEAVHRKTMIPKAMLTRLAYRALAQSRGLPEYPFDFSDTDPG